MIGLTGWIGVGKKVIAMERIEKAQFNAYKIIKDLGYWHMDSRSAIEASGLPQNIYLEIKRNFNELNKKYGGDNK